MKLTLIFGSASMLSISQACHPDACTPYYCDRPCGPPPAGPGFPCRLGRAIITNNEQMAAFTKFEDETGKESEVNSDFLSNFFRMEDLE